MTTKSEMIALIKAESPTLQVGSDETGYTQLDAAEYEAQIELWADNRLAKEAALAAEELATQAKNDAAAKLSALGIDPKALGL